MLSNFELSVAIKGFIFLQIVVYITKRITSGSIKPKGSITEDGSSSSEVDREPVNPISFLISYFGFLIILVYLFRLIVHSINISWESSDLYRKAIQLPYWINYIGVFFLWFCGLLKGFIFAYNINVTPFCLPMKRGYTLATGGPYKYVRHPLYVHHVLLALSIFMMTGIIWLLVSLFCLLSLVLQAYSEEKALQKIFGKDWDDYASKTGMFIPKLFKFQRAIIKE